MYAAVDGTLIAIAGVSTRLVPATLIAVSTGGIAGRISGFYTGVTAGHDIDRHRRASRKRAATDETAGHT